MATLTIRISIRQSRSGSACAAEHGRSMEAELRAILSETVGAPPSQPVNLAEAIRRRFAPFGGVDELELHPRTPVPEAPRFDEWSCSTPM